MSVVIPVKDYNDRFLNECLESLKEVDYPQSIEVLVIKGGNISQARNLGIHFTDGEIIAFIDSDCVAPKNWLIGLVRCLRGHHDVGGVGGPNFSAPNDGSLGKAIDRVFSTFLGSLGSASLFNPSKPKCVDRIACINSAFWKKVLIEVGGFDERFELCEDTNVSFRVGRKYKLLFVSEPFVWHHRRASIREFAKQFYNYGVGRMRSVLTDKSYADPRIMLLFVGCLSFPFLVLAFPLVGTMIFSGYLILIFIEGFLGAVRARNSKLLCKIPTLFLVQHIGYFLGMLVGMFKGKWRESSSKSELLIRLRIGNRQYCQLGKQRFKRD